MSTFRKNKKIYYHSRNKLAEKLRENMSIEEQQLFEMYMEGQEKRDLEFIKRLPPGVSLFGTHPGSQEYYSNKKLKVVLLAFFLIFILACLLFWQ